METLGQTPKPVNGSAPIEEVSDEIDIEGMQVVKKTEIGVVRQLIHLVSQDRFIPVIGGMIEWMRIGKFTGHIHIQLNQGGVKKIETEQETK